MHSPPRQFGAPTECYSEEQWPAESTIGPDRSTFHDPKQDTKSQRSTEHPTEGVGGNHSADKLVTAPDIGPVFVLVQNPDTKAPPDIPQSSSLLEKVQQDGLKEYARGDIELQLATLTGYIRNKKLRPIEWTCCSCSKEQTYRESLEALDRLRCQYPRCGVSDKGFRIYHVHNMCEQCTVFVDQRVPVTKKALKKKRDEVREVLRKVKKIYEDVDRLGEFDDKEAESMANLMKAREAKEEIEREKQEEEYLHKVEMEKQKRDEWIDEDGDHSGSEYEYGETAELGYGTEGEEEKWRREMEEKRQKRRGLKGLLGFRV